jgi:hypothetical protein
MTACLFYATIPVMKNGLFFSVFCAVAMLVGGVLAPVLAQPELPSIPGAARSVCGVVRSTIPFKIYGTLSTDVAGQKDGVDVRHKSAFSLTEGQRIEVCSQGPFYEGERLELTLKTMFPVFSCRTKIDREITLSVIPRTGGGYDYSATCF